MSYSASRFVYLFTSDYQLVARVASSSPFNKYWCNNRVRLVLESPCCRVFHYTRFGAAFYCMLFHLGDKINFFLIRFVLIFGKLPSFVPVFSAVFFNVQISFRNDFRPDRHPRKTFWKTAILFLSLRVTWDFFYVLGFWCLFVIWRQTCQKQIALKHDNNCRRRLLETDWRKRY